MTADVFAPWREKAACRTDPARFDQAVDGETAPARRLRLLGAALVCLRCPVAQECVADVDLATDSGVRGGYMIPTRRGDLVPIKRWLRTAPPPVNRKRKPATRQLPREHGTARGYFQHRDRDDMPACEPCRRARVKRVAS